MTLATFTDDDLRRLSGGTLRGERWPAAYLSGSEAEIDMFIEALRDGLQCLPGFLVESDLDPSGVHCSSYVLFEMFHSDDPLAQRRFAHPKDWVYRFHKAPLSLTIAVSKVAPFAAHGRVFAKLADRGVPHEESPLGDRWLASRSLIVDSLSSFGIDMCDEIELAKELPVSLPENRVEMDSNLRDLSSTLRLFDLLFWECD